MRTFLLGSTLIFIILVYKIKASAENFIIDSTSVENESEIIPETNIFPDNSFLENLSQISEIFMPITGFLAILSNILIILTVTRKVKLTAGALYMILVAVVDSITSLLLTIAFGYVLTLKISSSLCSFT